MPSLISPIRLALVLFVLAAFSSFPHETNIFANVRSINPPNILAGRVVEMDTNAVQIQGPDGVVAFCFTNLSIAFFRTNIVLDPEEQPGSPPRMPLEAIIPRGEETNPVAILHAEGIINIPNMDFIQSVGNISVTSFAFSEHFKTVVSKRRSATLFLAKGAFHDRLPPDLLGVGPFLLVKESGRFFVLTERNFAAVFGPLDKEDRVIPYLELYAAQFMQPFGNLVLKKEGHTQGNTRYYPEGSPEISRILASNRDGYEVRLVYYDMIGRKCFAALDVFVGHDGVAKKLRREILKDLGPGIVF
jgi:hypothetical protein